MISGSRNRRKGQQILYRHKKRLLGSSSWYKGNKKIKSENTMTTKASIGGAPQGPLDRRMVTRVVLFVEQSPMGELVPLATNGGW